ELRHEAAKQLHPALLGEVSAEEACKRLNEFENLVNLHERIISKIIKLTPVKELFFKDFNLMI
ncbi:MAG: hypothetical protein P8X91_06430, partial [Candidatus Bathyarchaeota archaeon]